MSDFQLLRTLLVMFTLEWELCNEDPVVFCYRMGVTLRASCSEDSLGAGVNFSGSACGANLPGHGCS